MGGRELGAHCGAMTYSTNARRIWQRRYLAQWLPGEVGLGEKNCIDSKILSLTQVLLNLRVPCVKDSGHNLT